MRGLVQGVGFRPAVWRLAHRFGLSGWVANDGEGVLMSLAGASTDISSLVAELRRAPPPLARIDAIERTPSMREVASGFHILDSLTHGNRTSVAPDAALCPACRAEIDDAVARRHDYPFANCTACGPRLSIVQAIPYDRANTTMRAFRMCAACAGEYADPADRRFHAQPIACAECGPRVWLHPAVPGDAIEAARSLLLDGRVVALKALGGFHLACDATNAAAVERLRAAKRRDAKPFALMARDLDVIRRFARVTTDEASALNSTAAPIVLLDALTEQLPGVAPGLATIGFMLPATPLHHLLLRHIDRPLVMTSGNLADEPQCIDNEEALRRLSGIADSLLLHDRPIARRVDDSLVRMMGDEARVLRRARGYAPAPIRLSGFAGAPRVLALGGELKNTFCLLRGDEAVMSHHIGDLENAATFADYRRAIDDYCALFDFAPQAIAVDRHPDYQSTRLGEAMGLPLIRVQHHHAHLAACLVENGMRLDEPVLGVILDGLGWGTDDTIWGGEFLLGDCRDFRRLACLRPVAMPGAAQAVREPWRNAVAHIEAAIGWQRLLAEYGDTEVARYLAAKPVAPLLSMIERGINAPLASSCGRLFDAVAAAIGLCRDRASYEGHAAMLLEAAAARATPSYTSHAARGRDGYRFAIAEADGMLHLDASPLWPALLADTRTAPVELIAARFHVGLTDAIAAMVASLDVDVPVALSGGAFHNRLLFELVQQRLAARGYPVLTHRLVSAGDGGLALGQAAIAAARVLHGERGD